MMTMYQKRRWFQKEEREENNGLFRWKFNNWPQTVIFLYSHSKWWWKLYILLRLLLLLLPPSERWYVPSYFPLQDHVVFITTIPKTFLSSRGVTVTRGMAQTVKCDAGVITRRRTKKGDKRRKNMWFGRKKRGNWLCKWIQKLSFTFTNTHILTTVNMEECGKKRMEWKRCQRTRIKRDPWANLFSSKNFLPTFFFSHFLNIFLLLISVSHSSKGGKISVKVDWIAKEVFPWI